MAEPVVLWYRSPQGLIPRWLRKVAMVVCVVGFLASCVLWGVHVNDQYWMESGPHVSVTLPYVRVEVLTLPAGVQFRGWWEGKMCWPKVTFPGRAGWTHYDRGYHVAGLGLVAVWSPHFYRDPHVLVPPHAVLGLPYWLLIMGWGWLSLKVTGLWGCWAPYREWSGASWFAAVFLTLAWVSLNVVPRHVQEYGGRFWPHNLWELLIQPLWPLRFYSKVIFTYGFPFTWLTQKHVDGNAVRIDHGSDPFKMVENFCVLVAAVWLAKLVLGVRRERRFRRAGGSRVPAFRGHQTRAAAIP